MRLIDVISHSISVSPDVIEKVVREYFTACCIELSLRGESKLPIGILHLEKDTVALDLNDLALNFINRELSVDDVREMITHILIDQ